MPLTKEQKAFLILKEFTGYSDDELFGNDEELQTPQTQDIQETFDSLPNEAEEVNPNASMDALTSIDQQNVNHTAVKSVAEQLTKVADNKAVSTMVQKYKREVADLFMRDGSIPYDNFKRFLLRLIDRDFKQNRTFCYAAILSLSKSEDLISRHGSRVIFCFRKLLMEKQFADVAASSYDQNSGTSV